MSLLQLEVQLVALVVAVACALPGVFLVLRGNAMLSDAISHTILFGIVVGYFLTGTTDSPLLFVGAVLTGVLTVSLVELLSRTRLVQQDTAIGLVFPVLFSIAVILITRYAGNVHLDTDAVVKGELAFAPFDRTTLLGIDMPRALAVGSGTLLLNALFIGLCYKELKLATFDAGLAATLGLLPALLHYALMTVVSVTAVAAFDAVGSILVIALIIAPPAAAYLLTNRLSHMIGVSTLLAAVSAISGYWVAYWLDTTIAGAIAMMTGVVFGLAWLFAPQRGLLTTLRRRTQQRWQFARQMLTIHLLHHEDTACATEESRLSTLPNHLKWSHPFTQRVVQQAEAAGLIERRGDCLHLTVQGRQQAEALASVGDARPQPPASAAPRY